MESSPGTTACVIESALSSRRSPGVPPRGGAHTFSRKPPPCSAVTLAQSRVHGTAKTCYTDGPFCRTRRNAATSRSFFMGSVTLLIAFCCAGPHRALAQAATSSDTSPSQDDEEDSPAWVTLLQYLVIVVLVVASGMFSGLTLGLLGLDKIGLEIIGNGDEPRMAAYAKVR